MSETLLESEMFGHEKGAFTGADSLRRGKFELADSGTIFLDEIGDISPKLQVDLLRVLQERSFYRLGGAQEVQVDCRVIAATHVNLEEAVKAGRFREDLFYRLNVIEIRIPPLRERRQDIPMLVQHFLERLSHELGKEVTGISEGALKLLFEYDWPGNVRELENAIERAMATCRSTVLTEDDIEFLFRAMRDRRGTGNSPEHDAGGIGETRDHRDPAAHCRQHQGVRLRAGYRSIHAVRQDQALRDSALVRAQLLTRVPLIRPSRTFQDHALRDSALIDLAASWEFAAVA